MMSLFLLFSLLAALSLAQPPSCGSICKFTMCNVGNGSPATKARRLTLRPPFRVPNGPAICISGIGDSVGRVVKTGNPILELREGGEIPLSSWRPGGLTVPFAKKFFQTRDIGPYRKSGVVKKPNRGNQQEFLKNLCIRLPILRYEEVDADRNPIRVVTGEARENCVAFRTRTMDLLVELLWDGKDDLDLAIDEPNGQTLNRFNPISGKGKFGTDASERCLASTLTGKETGFYRKDPDPGVYTVRLTHFQNCDGRPTNWKARVTIKGNLLVEKEGSVNLNNNDVITEFQFTYPE